MNQIEKIDKDDVKEALLDILEEYEDEKLGDALLAFAISIKLCFKIDDLKEDPPYNDKSIEYILNDLKKLCNNSIDQGMLKLLEIDRS